MRFIFIRHGETDWNKEGRFQGQHDIPLNQTGILQARRVVELIRDIPIDAVYSSPLERARNTAEIIVSEKNLTLFQDDRLKELDFGEWDGCIRSEIEAIDTARFREFCLHPSTALIPGEGSMKKAYIRVAEAIEDYRLRYSDADANVLIVSHATAIKLMILFLLGIGAEGFQMLQIDNAAVSSLRSVNGGFVLEYLNRV